MNSKINLVTVDVSARNLFLIWENWGLEFHNVPSAYYEEVKFNPRSSGFYSLLLKAFIRMAKGQSHMMTLIWRLIWQDLNRLCTEEMSQQRICSLQNTYILTPW